MMGKNPVLPKIENPRILGFGNFKFDINHKSGVLTKSKCRFLYCDLIFSKRYSYLIVNGIKRVLTIQEHIIKGNVFKKKKKKYKYVCMYTCRPCNFL